MLKGLLTDLAKRPSFSEEDEDCVRWATGTLFGGKLTIFILHCGLFDHTSIAGADTASIYDNLRASATDIASFAPVIFQRARLCSRDDIEPRRSS